MISVNTIRRLTTLGFLCSLCVVAETVDELVQQTIDSGGGIATGTNDEDGFFVVSTVIQYLEKNADLDAAKQTAQLRAKSQMGGFFNTEVNAVETLYSSAKSSSKDGQESFEANEEYFSSIESKVDQILSGTRMVNFKVLPGDSPSVSVSYLFSETVLNSIIRMGSMQRKIQIGAKSSEEVSITAIGMASMSSVELDEARNDAIQDAINSSIEMAFGMAVSANKNLTGLDPSAIKSAQSSAAFGNVAGYEIVDEGKEGDFYRVKIDAKVSQKIDLSQIVEVLQKEGGKFFLKATADTDEEAEALIRHFGEFFQGLGFQLSTHEEDADFLIDLDARFLAKKHPTTRKELYQLQIKCVYVNLNSGQALMTLSNDPRRAVSTLSDPIRRLDTVAAKALASMKKELQEKTGDLIMDMLSNGRGIDIAFLGVKNTEGRGYQVVEQVLNRTAGVKNVSKRIEASSGSLVFSCNFRGQAKMLQEYISEQLQAEFQKRPRLLALRSNYIEYEYK